MSASGARALLRPNIIGAIVARPSLWFTAVRQVARLAPHGWWRRRPFLPVPRPDYLEFRLVTQYGGGHGVAQGDIRVSHDRWRALCEGAKPETKEI